LRPQLDALADEFTVVALSGRLEPATLSLEG
jgi:hypothetical protein